MNEPFDIDRANARDTQRSDAQRAISVNSVDRFVSNLGSIASFSPNVLDRFDGDAWVEHYSDVLGVDASLIVASDKAAFVRQQRAQQQQQMQANEQANIAADTAQKAATAATTAGIPPSAADISGLGIGTADGIVNSSPGPLAPGAGF